MWDPIDTESKWRHAHGDVPRALLALLQDRKQQIGVLETLGAAAPFTSLPNKFRGRDVILFIDNVGALVSLAKGYAKALDAARIVHSFHSVCAAVQSNVWMEYVASGANIADLPSRNDLALLQELGSEKFEIEWPSLSESWAEVFSRIMRSYGPPRSKTMRKMGERYSAAMQALRHFY